jgi:DNA-binding ferritin-like protein
MNVITPLVKFQQQIRIFHWQSDTYAQHKAFGKLYESLDGLVDEFVETYMGIFGRSKPTVTFQITLKPLDSIETVEAIIENFKLYLQDMSDTISSQTDLLNIRDELLALVNHLKYRLSLK